MSRVTHLDLDLLLGRSGSEYQARVLRSPAGDGQLVTFTRPFTDLELENFALKMGRSGVRTRRIETAPVAAAKQFGRRLFDCAFAGAVGECLRRSLDYAQSQGATLRIRLRFSDCAELADLPWELLYDVDDDWFFSLSSNTPVIRYVQLAVQPRAVPVSLPLKVLVIRSEPVDCPPLDLAAEWAQVSAALGDLSDTGELAVTELNPPTLRELRRALLRDTFHVLHYMGHGGFDQASGGVLLFTDPDGRSVPVTGENLGVMLRDHTSLRLAILNACEAGRTDPIDPFAGVADTLVRRGIPAVIAMQFEVSDQAAIEFAPALYGALAAGRSIDQALAEARKAIYAISPVEWATPVLYLRADDAHLFDISQHRQPPADVAARHADEGDGLCRERRFAEAEAAYRAALAGNPSLARAQAGLGEALYELKRYPEAEVAAREAIRLDPGYARARNALGDALHGLKRYAESEAAFREAIRLDPSYALAHKNLGVVLSDLGRRGEAEAAYREAIRLDPAYAEAHRSLGSVLAALGKQGESVVAYREAIRLDPGNAVARTSLGRALNALEQYDEAVLAYQEVIRRDPTNATMQNNLKGALRALNPYS